MVRPLVDRFGSLPASAPIRWLVNFLGPSCSLGRRAGDSKGATRRNQPHGCCRQFNCQDSNLKSPERHGIMAESWRVDMFARARVEGCIVGDAVAAGHRRRRSPRRIPLRPSDMAAGELHSFSRAALNSSSSAPSSAAVAARTHNLRRRIQARPPVITGRSR